MKTTRAELISQRLKEARDATGKTQKQVGETLKVSRGTISGYETGQRLPSVDMICELAQHYNTEIGYLLGMESDDKSEKSTELDPVKIKYTIKNRFLDLSQLSPASKKEILNYYRYLMARDLEESN